MDPKNLTRQRDEVEVLSEILNQDEFSCQTVDETTTTWVIINVNIVIPDGFRVMLTDGNTKMAFKISHLPPIRLEVFLHGDYPSKRAPDINLSCNWLSQDKLDQLATKLQLIWEKELNEILFTWYTYIKDESLKLSHIVKQYDISEKFACEIEQTKGKHQLEENQKNESFNLYTILIEFNTFKLKEEFSKSTHACSTCFLFVRGVNCRQFPCGHTTCVVCLKNMLEVHIKDGTINRIVCPEVNCELEFPVPIIKELVSDDLFERFDRLTLYKTLDEISDRTFCPLVHCQYPIIPQEDESLTICPSCRHSFCKYCRKTYHGIQGCDYKSEERQKVIESYVNGDHTKKMELEKRYGKKQLKQWVQAKDAELWKAQNSKQCPTCRTHIEKNQGCHKIVCAKCNTNFCWLCMTRLASVNPYLHFTAPNSRCYQKLFEGLTPEELDEIGEDDLEEDWLDDWIAQMIVE